MAANENTVKLLSTALRLAERAHAKYELKGGKDEWPDFYAQWLVDNLHIWSAIHTCDDGSCEVHAHGV